MNKITKAILTIFFLFFMSSPVLATTYYSDFSTGTDSNAGTSQGSPWKHAPGMNGWTGSATLSGGDTVVLKGGVTWAPTSHSANIWDLPANINITGGQMLGTPWGTGYPILDGSSATGVIRGIIKTNGYTGTINGIKIYNTELSPSGGSGILLSGTLTNVEIENCYLDHTGDQSILLGPSGSSSHVLIHDSTTSNVGRLFVAVDDGNVLDDIEIYNNTFLGHGSWPGGIGDLVHGDGIIIGSGCTAANTCLTNLLIHHNKFSGDWISATTALIFLQNGTASGSSQYGGNHAQIYDNQFAVDTDGVISSGMIYVWSKWNDIKIYSNTFGSYYSGSNPISSCIQVNDAATNIDVKNNIFSGCNNSAVLGTSSNFSAVDYNFYSSEIVRFINGWTGNQDCRTIATCQSQFGQEAHGKTGDPKFITLPNGTLGHGNWHLQSSSPAIGQALQMNASFTTDADGVTRGSTWDMGAYEYTSGGSPTITSFIIPSNYASLTVPITTFTATDSGGAGITGYCLVMTNSSAGCSWVGSAPSTYTFGSTGSQTLYAFVKDANSTSSSSSGSVMIDMTSPTVTISTSSPQAISSNALTVTGTASDNVGVVSCKYRIGSAPDGGAGTACSGTTSWNCSTSSYSSGANTLYIGCGDAAGNWASSSITVNYTPGTSPPTVLTGGVVTSPGVVLH